jgi:hypothetical protein
MKEKTKNSFANPDRAGQIPPKRGVMRNIAALGIVCMLLFAAVSCESSKEPYANGEMEEETEASINPCACQEKKSFFEVQSFPRGEVFLFKDYVPSEFLYPENTGDIGPFIMYHSESNKAYLFLPAP